MTNAIPVIPSEYKVFKTLKLFFQLFARSPHIFIILAAIPSLIGVTYYMVLS